LNDQLTVKYMEDTAGARVNNLFVLFGSQ